jgi:DNA-binding XRE family transcriptional regulator
MKDQDQTKRFRALLNRIGINQAQLARDTGMNINTISRWARGWQQAPGILWAYMEMRAEQKEFADRVLRNK